MPEKWGLMILDLEQLLKFQMRLIDSSECKVQGVITVTQSEEPLGGMYVQPHLNILRLQVLNLLKKWYKRQKPK